MTRSVAAIAAALALTACNPSAQEPAAVPSDTAQPAGAASGPAHAVPAAAAQGANALISAQPGIASCDAGSDIKISWNVTSRPDVANVEIWLDGADAKLFASGGASGEQQSGPWVKPGTTFILRNQADKSELDRVAITGDECDSAPTS
ncbi:hypothetical protein [Cognatilysobacter xinjiangensis]|nr:hypothetical protein [Lysobacter xinjiangensis]